MSAPEETRALIEPRDEDTVAERAPNGPKKRHSLRVAVIAIALSLLITAGVLAFAEHIERFQELGYLGGFLIMLIGSATIILPAPAFVFIFAMGSVLNPVLLGVAGGVGAALGEMTGYLAGYGGSAPLKDTPVYRRFSGWMDRYGLVAVFFLALIPNPLFDVAGMLAGASRMPVWQFLGACALGKTVRCIVLALGGYYGINWVRELLA